MPVPNPVKRSDVTVLCKRRKPTPAELNKHTFTDMHATIIEFEIFKFDDRIDKPTMIGLVYIPSDVIEKEGNASAIMQMVNERIDCDLAEINGSNEFDKLPPDDFVRSMRKLFQTGDNVVA